MIKSLIVGLVALILLVLSHMFFGIKLDLPISGKITLLFYEENGHSLREEQVGPGDVSYEKIRAFIESEEYGWKLAPASYAPGNIKIISKDFTIDVHDNFLILQINNGWIWSQFSKYSENPLQRMGFHVFPGPP